MTRKGVEERGVINLVKIVNIEQKRKQQQQPPIETIKKKNKNYGSA